MISQEASHGLGVRHMPVHPHAQGFQPLQEEERIERAERRSQIAQPFHPRLHDERKVAEGLVEADAVVALAWLQHLGEGALVPRKAARIHDHPADAGAVAADPLGGRLHHDVRAMFDRAAEVGRRKGVVDHERHIRLMGDCGHGGDVQHVDARVADGFRVDHLGARRDGAAEVLRVVGVDEGGVDAEAAQADVELGVGAAVEGAGRHDLIAGLEQAGEGDELGGLA